MLGFLASAKNKTKIHFPIPLLWVKICSRVHLIITSNCFLYQNPHIVAQDKPLEQSYHSGRHLSLDLIQKRTCAKVFAISFVEQGCYKYSIISRLNQTRRFHRSYAVNGRMSSINVYVVSDPYDFTQTLTIIHYGSI